jgi:hypothetical protein
VPTLPQAPTRLMARITSRTVLFMAAAPLQTELRSKGNYLQTQALP